VRQGAGLGRQLLTAAEDYARIHWHSSAVRMTVIAQRPELLAWYARRGYTPTGGTEAFPYDDIRFGEPQRPDLVLNVLRKLL
jgi:GNAT superfamily N-acetyltransferase